MPILVTHAQGQDKEKRGKGENRRGDTNSLSIVGFGENSVREEAGS